MSLASGKCPNKSSKEWKDLIGKHGEKVTWLLYVSNGFDIPSMEEAERMLERVRESSSLPGRESSFSEEREAEFMRRLGIAETELSKYGEQYNNAKTLDEKQEVARRIDEVLGFLTGEMPFGMTKESIMASPYYEEGNEDSKGFYDPKDKSMTLNIEENEGYKDYLNSWLHEMTHFTFDNSVVKLKRKMFYNLLSEKTKVKMKQLLEEMGHKNLSSEMVVEEYFAHTFGESMEIKSLSEIFNENNFLSLLEENMPNEIKDTFRQIIKTIKNGNGKKMYLDKRETTFRSSTTQNDNYPQRIVEEDGEGIGTSVNRGGNRRFGETGMGTVPETVSGGLQGISRGKEKFQTGSSLERTVGGYFQRGLEEEGLDPDDTFSDDNTVMDEADYLELEREFKEIFDLSPYPSPQERGAVSGESSFYYNVAAPQRPIRNDFENELDYQEATIIYNRNREIQREIERLDRETGFESVFYETIEDYIKQNKDYIHVQENSITNIAGAFNRRTKKIEFILPNLYDDYLSNRIEEVYMHEFVHAELYSSLYIDLVDRLNKMIEDSPIDIQVKFGDYLSEKGYKVFTTYMIVDEMLAFSISETAWRNGNSLQDLIQGKINPLSLHSKLIEEFKGLENLIELFLKSIKNGNSRYLGFIQRGRSLLYENPKEGNGDRNRVATRTQTSDGWGTQYDYAKSTGNLQGTLSGRSNTLLWREGAEEQTSIEDEQSSIENGNSKYNSQLYERRTLLDNSSEETGRNNPAPYGWKIAGNRRSAQFNNEGGTEVLQGTVSGRSVKFLQESGIDTNNKMEKVLNSPTNSRNPADVAFGLPENQAQQENSKPKNESNSDIKSTNNFSNEEVKATRKLRDSIIGILKELGVGVGTLERFEEFIGGAAITGLFDPDATKRTANGLLELIRVAQGEAGEQALPEEFAHLLDMILSDKSNPLYNRLTNLINGSPELVEQILNEEEGGFERYNNLYGGDTIRLAAEARTKLIARHLVNNQSISKAPEITRSLLSRILQWFEQLFSKILKTQLERDRMEADEAANRFTLELMDRKVKLEIDLNDLKGKGRGIMYQAKKSLDKAYVMLEKLRSGELKKEKIARASGRANPTDTARRKVMVTDIMKTIEDWRTLGREDGTNGMIVLAFEGAIEELNDVISRLEEIARNYENEIDPQVMNEIAGILRDMYQYVNYYKDLIRDMNDYIATTEFDDPETKQDLENVRDNLLIMTNSVESKYNNMGKPLFKQFIKPYLAEMARQQNMNDDKLEAYMEKILTTAERDESFYGTMCTAMANSRNDILRIFDLPVKQMKDKARMEIENIMHRLAKAQQDLEEAGENTGFLAERDKNGLRTGRHIQRVDTKRYNDDLTKYGTSLINGKKTYEERQELENGWIAEHTDENGEPRTDLYATEEYKRLSAAQKAYYDAWVEVKDKMDSYLPDSRILKGWDDKNKRMQKGFLPQKRKSKYERLKGNPLRNMKENIREDFSFMEDEDQYGDASGIEDFAGQEYHLLPVYYNSRLGRNKDGKVVPELIEQNLSEDYTTMLMEYANMAVMYNKMGMINNLMELGGNLVRNIRVNVRWGNRNISERLSELGQSAIRNLTKNDDTNINRKYQHFLRMQVYGKMIKQETIGKFNLTKSGDLLMKYTALNTFALNFLGGSANILMGRVQQRIEGFSGKYFTNKNLYNASYQYKKFLADFMKETASRRPHTFAGLLMRKFDVMQNFGEQARMTEMNRRGAWRLLNSRNLFFLNTMGEHFLYTRTFLAYADTIKLTLNGNPIKLVDAFEMKKINGIEELAIKKGVKNEDGSDFTDANINDISRTAADINQKLNGIYNRDDVAAAQYYVLGRMTAMFRKWIPTALQRRFGKEHYNYITNEVEKGFYNSFFNDFIWQSIRDMKNGQFRLASAWSRLDDNTKAGVRAALAEMGIWAFAGLLMPVIFGALGWDDDDDNDSWIRNYVVYLSTRLTNEIGVMMPLGFLRGDSMYSELKNIRQSAMAPISYMDKLVKIFSIGDWSKEYVQGTWKGWNKGVVNTIKAMPYVNPIKRAMDPEQAASFYRAY